MKNFQYKIKEEEGLHARPAGLLVKCAQGVGSDVTIACHGKQADAKRLFSVMGLAVRQGDIIEVAVSGKNEDADARTMEDFCRKSL